MSCEKCQFYRETRYEVLKKGITGELSCTCPGVSSERFSAALSDDEDCEHWYPNEREYTYSEGEWGHRCPRMPTDTQLLWDGGNKAWYLWPGIHDAIRPLFCPYCGLELEPMPEDVQP